MWTHGYVPLMSALRFQFNREKDTTPLQSFLIKTGSQKPPFSAPEVSERNHILGLPTIR